MSDAASGDIPSSGVREALTAARDIAVIALGVAVYGAAFGLLAAQAALTPAEVGFMGATVFAGSAQIIAVERLAAGAGAIAALVAAVALNLRLALITASIRDVYRDRPWWQVLVGAHLATDENWALLVAKRNQGHRYGYAYLVGGGLTIGTAWIVSTVVGVIAAGQIADHRALGLDFAFAAAFIAIARAVYRGRSDILPWAVAVAAVIAANLSGVIDASFGLIIGGLAGAATAALVRGEGGDD